MKDFSEKMNVIDPPGADCGRVEVFTRVSIGNDYLGEKISSEKGQGQDLSFATGTRSFECFFSDNRFQPKSG